MENLRLAAEKDLEPLERFKLLVKTHFNLLIDTYMNESKILFIEEEQLTRVSKKYQIEILDLYRRELKNLKKLGYVKNKNLTILAFNIFGVINWHLRWYKSDGRLSLDQMSEEMLSFVLHGVIGSSPV